jgi:predicted CXXCH cytochrome family protein
MRFRILRWIRAHATTGQRQYREIFIQTRRLTIGRGSDQHLQVADSRVFPKHAVIRPGRGREGPLVVEALTPSGVRINGKTSLQKNLQPGDEIQIGPAFIVVESLARGAPVTLRFRFAESEDTGRRLDRLHVLSLSDSGLSKRFWSLLLASGVAAIFLVVPMAAALYQPLRPLLRSSTMLPNDGWWTPGPLHTAHQFIGADCNTCHITPFTPIENTQCAACHNVVQHHVQVPSGDMNLFAQHRCADCHAEHNEKRMLVSNDQRVCTDCHSNLKAMKPRTRLMNAADFGKDHPEFRLTMLESQPGRNGVDWQTVKLDVLPGVKFVESSHLNFSHVQHLDQRGIKGPKGDEVLECKNCHTPDASGRYMVPIEQENQCGRCHSLRFDEADANTTVPHGDIEGVYRTLLAHFSQQYLEGVPIPTATRGRPSARRPGSQSGVMTRGEQVRARDWAEQMALGAARDLFERRVCVDCHEVQKMPDQVGLQQWKVEPVRLTRSWMPQANFDHASHKTSRCVECHVGADISKRSSDVLMPTLTECRACHSGPQDDRNKLPSDCLMCHQFHLPDRGLFDQDATIRARSLPRTDAQRRLQASGRAGVLP